MGASLSVQLLEGHRAEKGSDRATPREIALKPDHIVLDGASGRIAVAAFAELSLDRVRTDLALIGLAGLSPHAGGGAGQATSPAVERARRAGARVTELGRAGCDPLYRERFAAPGRLVVASGHGVATAGAMATLALSLEGLEGAAVMAGAPCFVDRPGILGIRLEGEPLPWVSGLDVALAVARRAAHAGLHGCITEFVGRGAASLTMADRIVAVSEITALGAAAALFPSDERTRTYLAALGREPDWKPLEPAYDAAYDRELGLDLFALEPLIASEEDLAGARAVRHTMGMPIARVVIGARASFGDLARLAHMLAGRHVHADTELLIVPGSPALIEAAESVGALADLTGAGARIVHSGLPPDLGWASSASGTGLFTASSGEHRSGRRLLWYTASLETCAATALAGSIADPRELEELPPREGRPLLTTGTRFWVLDPPEGAPEPHPSANGRETLDRPLRGGVLIKLGDAVSASDLLPFGARQQALLEDLPALGGFAMEPLDSDFAARALRQGSGFVVAGRELALGEPGEIAAIVLRSLGVRAILARSFEPRFHARLVHAGVLPLEIRHESDYRMIAAGDELEIPGLPGALEPGKPLTVRNLTRASQHMLGHALDPRRIAMVREGGLIGSLARQFAAVRGSV